MPESRFVTYARVSTRRQGQRGLTLDAQRHALAQYLGANPGHVLGAFVEVESGRKADRPELAKALALCRDTGATLVVAKLDRLARNAAFLLALRDSRVEFVCADMPTATRLTIGLMAVIAEAEADAISERTRAAIAERKRRGLAQRRPEVHWDEAAARRGRALGNARRRAAAQQRAVALLPVVQELRRAGAGTLQALAGGLNARGIPAPRGGRWRTGTVTELLRHIGLRPTLEDAMRVIREELRHRGGYRERNLRIYDERVRGRRPLRELAAKYGLSPERIRQLCYLERRRRAHHGRVPLCVKQTERPIVDLRAALEEMLMEF